MWTADGTVSEHWLPISPSGRLDGYVWRVPLEEIGVVRPVIEPEPSVPAEPAAIAAAVEASPALPSEPEPQRKAQKPAVMTAARAKTAEPVIPLVHAPDDPGPDAALESDPLREASTPLAPWERFKQLFR
jgi:HemY protein